MSSDVPDGPNAPGNPNPPRPLPPLPGLGAQGAPLTTQQRAALLRACRTRLMQLHEDCEGMLIREAELRELQPVIDEIALLDEGIAWLWRYTVV